MTMCSTFSFFDTFFYLQLRCIALVGMVVVVVYSTTE